VSRPEKITVKELIEKLREFNPDHHVITAISGEMETYAAEVSQMGPATVRISGEGGEEYLGQDDPEEYDDEDEENSK
jgi:hypothetical protein